MLEADPDELDEVARRDPDGEPAPVGRRLGNVADADAHRRDAVFVGVERRHPLAEGLAEAVAGVRPDDDVLGDRLGAPIEADGVVRRGEDDPPHPFEPRRLEEGVGAEDVGLVDGLPVGLERVAAEMDDTVDPGDRPPHRLEVGEVGRGVGLALGECRDRPAVREAEPVARPEERPDHRCDATGGTGEENELHRQPPRRAGHPVRPDRRNHRGLRGCRRGGGGHRRPRPLVAPIRPPGRGGAHRTLSTVPAARPSSGRGRSACRVPMRGSIP